MLPQGTDQVFAALRQRLNIPNHVQIEIIYEDLSGINPNPLKSTYGFTHREDNDLYHVHIHNRLNPTDFFRTLAHEMRHVEQLAVRRCLRQHKSRPNEIFGWKGIEYRFDAVRYERRPHEIEAKAFEDMGVKIALDLGILDVVDEPKPCINLDFLQILQALSNQRSEKGSKAA